MYIFDLLKYYLHIMIYDVHIFKHRYALALNSSTKRIVLHHNSQYDFQCNTINITRFLTFQKAIEINNIILRVNGKYQFIISV